MTLTAGTKLWRYEIRSKLRERRMGEVFGQPQKVFDFTDKDVRIDYPVWSPDGKRTV